MKHNPESELQERSGPIFDVFMFLFVMAFIAWLKIVAAWKWLGSLSGDEFAGPDCRCVICATERFLFRKLTTRKESHE